MNMKVRNIREDMQFATDIANDTLNYAVARTVELSFHPILTMLFIQKLAEINIRDYRKKIINGNVLGFEAEAKEKFLNKVQNLVDDVVRDADNLHEQMIAAGGNPNDEGQIKDFLDQQERKEVPPKPNSPEPEDWDEESPAGMSALNDEKNLELEPSCRVCGSPAVARDGLCNACRG